MPLHDNAFTDATEILDYTTHQSLPEIGDETINIDFNEGNHLAEGNEDFFGGDAHLSLSLWEGLYSGTLASPKFGDLDFYCWGYSVEFADDFNPENDMVILEKEYHYNQESGKCENADGEEGYNNSSVVKVRETGDGECANMSYWELEEQDYGYPNLEWDVRGSLMYGTQIHFANMIGADFRGANMTGLEYGYTYLRGVVDEYTLLPVDCEAFDNEIDCMR